MRRSVRRRLAALLVLGVAALVGACAEQLDGGALCPALCPVENAAVRDTVLDAVSLDSSIAGFPVPGDPVTLLLATRPGPDSLDVRAVVRFDSLPGRFFPPAGGDSLEITRVDSSVLRLRFDTTDTLRQAATLEAYDVDTAAAVDTSAAALAALFRPERRLGTVRLAAGAVPDSVRLPLSDAAVAGKTRGSRRLRVGLRVVSAGAAQLRLFSTRGGNLSDVSVLRFDPATDTLYRPLTVLPASGTPGVAEVAAGLEDFSFVVRSPRAPLGTDLVVGGAPARRVFLRFAVPRALSDSSTIVRATLELVQRPATGFAAGDSIIVRPEAVLATDSVTDLRRAADFVAGSGVVRMDSLRLSPAGSGTRVFSIVSLVRAWRSLPPGTQRAVVLRASAEGTRVGEVRFHSREAAAELRPRLRISYVPRTEFGLP